MNELLQGVFAMVRQTKDPKNKKILKVLPEPELITYQLYFHERVRQVDIAKLLHMSQGGVTHRLRKSMRRLRYAFLLPQLTAAEKREAQASLEPFLYDLCMFMAQTTCQSVVADMLNDRYNLDGDDRMTQVKVRYRFKKVLKKLKGPLKHLSTFRDLMEHTDKNLYILHWVDLPHFKRDLDLPRTLTKKAVLKKLAEA